MRSDALSFSPFAERDPAFAQILQQAKDEEVNILAMKFDAGKEMKYMGELELLLPPVPFSGFWPDRP
jgi:DNA-binding sugar fermentation-stimulating protein